MRDWLSAAATALVLITVYSASPSSALSALTSDDWKHLAYELADVTLSPELADEHFTYEQSVLKEGDYWVAPSSVTASDFSWPGGGGRSPSPGIYYDFLQQGHLPLSSNVAAVLGVKPAKLPDWTVLTRKERLQLFSTFNAPEHWLNSTPERPPLHLTLACQMAQHDMDKVDVLDQLLEAAFGDPETSYKLWIDQSAHHDWKSRFAKRYLRFILNYETLSFFEPWHEELSPGNGYIRAITGEKARKAIVAALKAMPDSLLMQRLKLSPAQVVNADRQEYVGTFGYGYSPFDGDSLAQLVKGSIATGQIWRWCRPYYFRVYGENRLIAEGIALAPEADATATYRLRVFHGHSGEGYTVYIANEAYGFHSTRQQRGEGVVEFWEVPAYVLDGLTYSVSLPNGRISKVVSADTEVVAPGEIDVKLRYE